MMSTSIAIVEDDEPIVELLCETLTEEGYTPTVCMPPGQALTLIRGSQPDLILVDVQLHGSPGGGIQVIEQIRQEPALAHTPIIAMSASRQLLRAHAKQLNAAQCVVLEKPFDLADLLSLVATLLNDAPQGRTRQAGEAWDAN
jgi:CheY-like chemotaxis protein